MLGELEVYLHEAKAVWTIGYKETGDSMLRSTCKPAAQCSHCGPPGWVSGSMINICKAAAIVVW